MAPQDGYPPWKIVRRLGAGSLTEAFLVEGPEGIAVLKRPLPFFADNEALCSAFVLGAEGAKALSHPGIVKVIATGSSGRDRYVVIEQVQGRPLSRAVATMSDKGWAALPHDAVAAIGLGAAEALSYAHREGVLHLDVSLRNLYLTARGELKIADFGLAQARRTTSPDSEARELLPPELRGPSAGRASPTADIWALGLCLYQLAGGALPTNPETLPPLSTCVLDVDADFAAIVERMLAHEPARRFQTMAEVQQAFSKWLRDADAVSLRRRLFAQLFDDAAPVDEALKIPRSRAYADEKTPAHGARALTTKFKLRAWHVAVGVLAGGTVLLYLLLWLTPLDSRMPLLGSNDPALTGVVTSKKEWAKQHPSTNSDAGTKSEVAGNPPTQDIPLPRSTSAIPAKFIVSSDRHGFYYEQKDRADIHVVRGPASEYRAKVVDEKEYGFERFGRVFGIAYTPDGPVLFAPAEELTPLPPKTYDVRFVLVGKLDTGRTIDAVTEPDDYPAHFDFRSVPLSLQDDERFAVFDLKPKTDYAIHVKSLKGNAGLLTELFTWDQAGVSYTMHGQPELPNAVKNAALLFDGNSYVVRDARKILFTMARSTDHVSRYEVEVTEMK